MIFDGVCTCSQVLYLCTKTGHYCFISDACNLEDDELGRGRAARTEHEGIARIVLYS